MKSYYIIAMASTVMLLGYLNGSVLKGLGDLNNMQMGGSEKRANPIIYEISTRPWLYELSQKYKRPITLANIPDEELERLQQVGVDYVWMMGIWQLGEWGLNFDRSQESQIEFYKSIIPGKDFTMEDIIGSPYAVVEYSCNKEFGTNEDIVKLRQRLNSLGMKLMLDFVPNHSAVDAPYVTEHIDWYIRAPQHQGPYDRNTYLDNGVAYGSDMYDAAWMDTAQWNYWNQDARTHLKSVVKYISSMADGIRCDMAMVILNDGYYTAWKDNLDFWGYTRPSQEFWSEAIREAKALYPDTIFLAEVYWGKEQELISLGFDFVYEKELLDTLATEDLSKIRPFLDFMDINYHRHANHFVENHDEPRAVSKFGNKDYVANVAALLSYTLPGAKFIFHGQLEGYRNKLDVHLRRGASEAGSAYSKWFYSQLMPIISRDVFHNGSEWSRCEVVGNDSWKFFSWRVTNGKEKVLVVINYSEGQGYAAVKVADASSGKMVLRELMSNQTYERDGDEMRWKGLGVVVDGWNAQIFQYH